MRGLTGTNASKNLSNLKKGFRPGKKKFGSGQLIFENWSGGPVDFFFFEAQPEFSKSN